MPLSVRGRVVSRAGCASCNLFGNSPANRRTTVVEQTRFRAQLPLGGESFGGELLVRRRFHHIRGRRGLFFLDLGEQPGLNHGARLPFDFFLRSLAEELGERAIVRSAG